MIVNNRARLLAITSEVPWPLTSGGHLRTYHLLNAISHHIDVELVCPKSHGDEYASTLPLTTQFRLDAVATHPRNLVREVTRAAQAQWYRCPYVMYYRHWHRQVVRHWNYQVDSKQPDFLWLDHIDSFLYVPKTKPRNAIVIIDLHNIYSLILARLADETANPWRRLVLTRESVRMAEIERRVCKTVDVVIAVSEIEAAHFRRLGASQVFVVPNGVDCQPVNEVSNHKHDGSPIILFVGAMSWQPNISAAVTLATEIFPKIQKIYPTARLNLVGKDPVADVQRLSQIAGVTVTGTVASIQPYFAEASVMAVPLNSGGGTRLKILEAFASGVPVVTTAIGVEGIDAVDGTHMYVTDIENMGDRIINLLASNHAKLLTQAARALVYQRYDWQQIGTTTSNLLNSLSAKIITDDR